ncbi:GLPGLI family protein [Psychroflexus salis]|uniref:GLPGLI family protein n=2 Tax=Psychroflexus salis TaxID=1526574 RepID=A0A916ZVE6_9FLAO|nr:GLPGLI family protein [Psychroflexus salis]
MEHSFQGFKLLHMRHLFLISFFFILSISFAQVAGTISYTLSLDKERATKKIKNNKSDSNSNLFILKQINEFEKVEAKLIFNKHESSYKVVESLDSDSNNNFNLFEAKAGAKSEFYSDILNDIYFYTSLFDDSQLVAYPKFKWNIKNEFKNILGFECQKAEIISSDDKNRVAWFTKDISVPFGPLRYHGLPGLVLLYEEDGGLLILEAVDISFDDHIEIKKPEGKLTDEESHKKDLRKKSSLYEN